MSSAKPETSPSDEDNADDTARQAEAISFVKAARKVRDARNSAVPPGLFADPRWEMMTELFLASSAGSRMSTTEIISVAGIAPTTGLRHLARLEAAGLVTRVSDPDDGRRVFVHLKDEARQMMVAYLAAVKDVASKS